MKFYYVTLFYFLGMLSSAVSEWDGDCDNAPDLIYDDTCCNNGLFFASDDGDETCLDRYNVTAIADSEDFTMEHANITFCYLECFFNESNYIKNGTIDIDALTSGTFEIAKANNVTNLAILYKDVVSNCLSQSNNGTFEKLLNEFSEFLNNETSCSPNAFMLVHCSTIRYLQSCPEKYWSKENPGCKDTKLYIEKCPLIGTDEDD